MTKINTSNQSSNNIADFNVRFGDLFSNFNNPLNIKTLAENLLKEEINPFQKIVYKDLIERCDTCINDSTPLTVRDLWVVKKQITDKNLAQKMSEVLFDETPGAKFNASSMQAIVCKGNKSAFEKFSPSFTPMEIVKVGKKDVFMFSYLAQKKKKKLVLKNLDNLSGEDIRKILNSDAKVVKNNDADLLNNIVRISPEITRKFITKFKDTLTEDEFIKCIKGNVSTIRLSAYSAEYNVNTFNSKVFPKELFDLTLFLYSSMTPKQYQENFLDSSRFGDNFVKYVFDVPVIMNAYTTPENEKTVLKIRNEVFKKMKPKIV